MKSEEGLRVSYEMEGQSGRHAGRIRYEQIVVANIHHSHIRFSSVPSVFSVVNQIPETSMIRAEHLVDAKTFSKMQGQPIFAEELEDEILRVVGAQTRGDGGERVGGDKR